MATTVEEGFRDFLKRLTPSSSESEAAKRHRASICDCLDRAFEIIRFFRTGSFGNGTSIRHYSDVDYFAVIPPKHLSSSSATVLDNVREVLDRRFPRTGVTVRTPAVVVPFGTEKAEWTEVVPAGSVKNPESQFPVYKIAAGGGAWTHSSPETHNSYVAHVDKQLGNKVKPLVRLLKAWKFFQKVPILSFYLELRVSKYASGEAGIVYSVDVKRVLQLLWDRRLAPIQDPTGISGNIYPCSSDAKQSEALSKLETALQRAEKAVDAEGEGNIADAFYWWDKLFGGNFPSYG